jgi:lipoyl(octanoyl) transferase
LGGVQETKKICWVVDLGLIAYGPACNLQQRLVAARKSGAIPDVLLFCEHPHVITLGRNGKRDHLRVSEHLLAQRNVEFCETDRGGDITYHGPGQIVGYPILNLAEHRGDKGRDVGWYVEQLEETMIRATGDFGVCARRSDAGHGAWIDARHDQFAEKVGGAPSGVETPDGMASVMSDLKVRPPKESTPWAECAAGSVARTDGRAAKAGEEKLGALGVRLSRWVTSHGFAYNVSTDLRYFELIVPCGIAGKRATSLERVLGRAVRGEEVRARLAERFGEVFQRAMISVTRAELEEALEGEREEVGAVRGRER